LEISLNAVTFQPPAAFVGREGMDQTGAWQAHRGPFVRKIVELVSANSAYPAVIFV
jgi:hypothetical protein